MRYWAERLACSGVAASSVPRLLIGGIAGAQMSLSDVSKSD